MKKEIKKKKKNPFHAVSMEIYRRNNSASEEDKIYNHPKKLSQQDMRELGFNV